MAYEKHTWSTGETITADKLNHMEDGIANSGGSLVVHVDDNDTLDKTWQEIYDALSAGTYVVCLFSGITGGIAQKPIYDVDQQLNGSYTVYFNDTNYVTDVATGYPSQNSTPM